MRRLILPHTLLPLVISLIAAACGRVSGDADALPADAPERLSPPLAPRLLDDSLPPVLDAAPPPAVAMDPEPEGRCDPNYTPCVPVDSDVDCEGGSGNGPSYVAGPVEVIGRDVYRLDADHDGIGCED